MGLGSFLKSLISPEAMSDEIIAIQERAYREAQKMYPGAVPHVLLAQVWLSRMTAHGKNPMDERRQTVAFSDTMQFACVAPPDNVRALALFFIYKERPDILEKNPKFAQEFQRLVGPVMEATQNCTVEGLYRKFNPTMAAERG
ncbi:MAG: hypothetical protein HYU77_07285 [Betaproteobacteria bacterium]|nr:hypothetical protein [Betaproteobacteria bacterium]